MNIEIGDNLRTWTIICALLCLMTIGVAVAHYTIPSADAKLEERRGKAHLEAAIKDRKASEEKLAALEIGDTAMWEGVSESVTSQILQSVTVIAKTQNINLKSFRPQTAVADGDLSRNNYVVLIEGSFPQVVGFIRSIDTPSSRLGISLVQVSASDQETDSVNATVGIVAYVKMPDATEVAKNEKKATGSESTTTNNVDPNMKKTMNDEEKSASQPKEQK